MKSLLILATLLSSPFLFAETYVCQVQRSNQTITFKKLKDLPVNPRLNIDTKAEYVMELQTGELPFPSVSVKGVATTADVHFTFKSADGKYQAFMYLDDAEGTLNHNRKKYNFSDCQFFKN
nr:hypothetical protein HAGR004_40960 [Bdellovibrio sp. HAGR004]